MIVNSGNIHANPLNAATRNSRGGLQMQCVSGIRLSADDDMFSINQRPTMIVVETKTDLVHLEMHLSESRLVLTPLDRVSCSVDEPHLHHAHPWLSAFVPETDDLAALESAVATACPSVFAPYPKRALVRLSRSLRARSWARYNPVIAFGAGLSTSAGLFFDISQIDFASADDEHADIIVCEPTDVEKMISQWPSASLLAVVAMVNHTMPLEALNAQTHISAGRALMLNRVVSGMALTDGSVPTIIAYKAG